LLVGEKGGKRTSSYGKKSSIKEKPGSEGAPRMGKGASGGKGKKKGGRGPIKKKAGTGSKSSNRTTGGHFAMVGKEEKTPVDKETDQKLTSQPNRTLSTEKKKKGKQKKTEKGAWKDTSPKDGTPL